MLISNLEEEIAKHPFLAVLYCTFSTSQTFCDHMEKAHDDECLISQLSNTTVLSRVTWKCEKS